MKQIEVTVQSGDLKLAAWQEALRWQAYVRQLPLFLITLGVLAILAASVGFGILRGMDSVSPPLQVFALIGYSVFYWGGFTLARLIQGRFKAGRTRRARFGKREQQTLLLELADGLIRFREQGWDLNMPVNRISATYTTRDFVFLESSFLPWLPLGTSPKLKEFLAGLRNTKAAPKTAP